MVRTQADRSMVTITGLVLPGEWNSRFDCIAVVIHCPDEAEYLVDNAGVGAELLRLTHRRVRARGRIREKRGAHILKVASYEVLPGSWPDVAALHDGAGQNFFSGGME